MRVIPFSNSAPKLTVKAIWGLCVAAGLVTLSSVASAQDENGASEGAVQSCMPQGFFAGPASYQSVEQLPDGRITFRLCAPEAQEVRVTSNDIADVIPMGFAPGAQVGLEMVKDASGLWSVTTALPVAPDTYRFNFRVDGARVPDPQGTTWSQERVGINSTFEALGPEGAFQSYRPDVAHGMVTKVEYWSASLGIKRPAMVYTPPGYMNGTKSYPVLYLVHGAGDHADSWTSVGHANYILDNLLAQSAAQEMIIVMPFGHTPDRPGANMIANTDFGEDLIGDLIPFIDSNFRTIATAQSRAMAGLSMGGAHTIRFGLTNPELFDYIGIFSMGLGLQGPDDVAQYEEQNHAALTDAAQSLDLVYYAMGTEDFLYASVQPTRAMLDKYGIEHVYNESGGGHTWINWRRYLADFLPRLFPKE